MKHQSAKKKKKRKLPKRSEPSNHFLQLLVMDQYLTDQCDGSVRSHDSGLISAPFRLAHVLQDVHQGVHRGADLRFSFTTDQLLRVSQHRPLLRLARIRSRHGNAERCGAKDPTSSRNEPQVADGREAPRHVEEHRV